MHKYQIQVISRKLDILSAMVAIRLVYVATSLDSAKVFAVEHMMPFQGTYHVTITADGEVFSETMTKRY